MMRAAYRSLLVSVLIASASSVFAQSYFRFELFRSQTVLKSKVFEPGLGMGFERATSDRTSLGFDIWSTWSSAFSGASGYKKVPFFYIDQENFTFQFLEIHYRPSRTVLGFDYHSDLALSDVSDGHAYVGVSLGLVYLSTKIETLSVVDQSTGHHIDASFLNLPKSVKDSDVFFPIGLRTGFRGAMDGFYWDVTFGGGVNLSARELAHPFYGGSEEISPYYMQVALAFGIGG